MVDAVSHPKPRTGDQEVWPIQMTLRGSEGAQRVKDAWLSPSFATVLGKDFDLGLKISRYLPSTATRLVMRDLGEDPEPRVKVKVNRERVRRKVARQGRLRGRCRINVDVGSVAKS